MEVDIEIYKLSFRDANFVGFHKVLAWWSVWAMLGSYVVKLLGCSFKLTMVTHCQPTFFMSWGWVGSPVDTKNNNVVLCYGSLAKPRSSFNYVTNHSHASTNNYGCAVNPNHSSVTPWGLIWHLNGHIKPQKNIRFQLRDLDLFSLFYVWGYKL
jgi:hypothetical protein